MLQTTRRAPSHTDAVIRDCPADRAPILQPLHRATSPPAAHSGRMSAGPDRNNMHAIARTPAIIGANRELLALLLASIAFVCILTLSLAHGRPTDLAGLEIRHLVVMTVVLGASMVGFGIVWAALVVLTLDSLRTARIRARAPAADPLPA